jgi:hypothetical protein
MPVDLHRSVGHVPMLLCPTFYEPEPRVFEGIDRRVHLATK